MQLTGERRTVRFIVSCALLALGAGSSGCNILFSGGGDDDDNDTDASSESGESERDPFYDMSGSWGGTWTDGNGTGPLEVTIDPYEPPTMLHFVTINGVWNAMGGSGRAPFEPPVSQHYIGEDHHWHLTLALIYDNGCGADLVRSTVESRDHITGSYGGDCAGSMGGMFELYRAGTAPEDGGTSPYSDGSIPVPWSDGGGTDPRDASGGPGRPDY